MHKYMIIIAWSHDTTPYRLDRTMQDIVAKLVPGIVEGKHEDKDHDIMKVSRCL